MNGWMLYPPKSNLTQVLEKTEKLVYGEEEVITKVKGTKKDILWFLLRLLLIRTDLK